MTKVNALVEESWKKVLDKEFHSPYFLELKAFLQKEKKEHQIYPPSEFIFEAFKR